MAATNAGLAQAVQRGAFRQDLFYRINVVTLFIPRLSERQEDIPRLIDLILRRLSQRYRKPILGVTPQLMQQLLAHDWPGNVRELENTLERAVLFATAPWLDRVEFSSPTPVAPQSSAGDSRQNWLAQAERDYLDQELRRCRGDVGQLAGRLGISRRAAYMKLKKHSLNPSRYRPERTT